MIYLDFFDNLELAAVSTDELGILEGNDHALDWDDLVPSANLDPLSQALVQDTDEMILEIPARTTPEIGSVISAYGSFPRIAFGLSLLYSVTPNDMAFI